MSNSSKKQAGRFIKVGGLSLRVAGSYLKQKISELFTEAENVIPNRMETHLRNAQRITHTIGEMKGTIMKLGQMLSLNAELLPPEITQALSTLQHKAPPVGFSQMKKQLEEGLQKSSKQVFAEIDEKPLASASIGQVHRARLHSGEEVVVKVQYPGVDQDVEGDLRNIKIILRTLKPLGGGFDMTHLMSELRSRMMEELDYHNEAKNLEFFRDLYQDFDRIRIPRPFSEFISKTVLTMEYLPGISLKDFSDGEATGTDRNRVAELLVRFYLKQLYQHAILHADPNPGNFAVGKNKELIVYDFGCIKSFPKSFIQPYRQLVKRYLKGESETIADYLDKMGVKFMGNHAPAPEFYEKFAQILMEPFLKEPYCFGDANLQEKMLVLARPQMGLIMNFRPPKHILFHNRVVVGVYNNLRSLRATGYWRSILDEYLV